MDRRLCSVCVGLKVRKDRLLYRHHESLQALKSCAERFLQPCSVCRLIWAAVKDNFANDKPRLQHFLHNWRTHPDLENAALYLCLYWREPPPDDGRYEGPSEPDFQSGWKENATCKLEYGSPSLNYFVKASKDIPGGGFLGIVGISVPYGSTPEIRGRSARESAKPQNRTETISIMRGWLDRCNRFDKRCCGRERKPCPSRLIYIKKKKPRLIEPGEYAVEVYVALSYSWGSAGRNMFKLRRANREAFLAGISLSKLCLTHRQAIQTAKELGYHFIWIDALCIMQDDKQDWALQASLVPEIYNNADLTIVAGRSEDANKGFLEPRYIPDTPDAHLPYECSTTFTSTVCRIGKARTRDIGPTNDRGWCYQELLMSRRAIIYGEQQLSFQCRERHEFEDGECNMVGQRDTWYNLLFPSLHSVPLPEVKEIHKPCNQIQSFRQSTRYLVPSFGDKRRPCGLGAGSDPALQRWYAMTAEYSKRSFYDPTDNHAAISGVARLFQTVLVERFGPGSDGYMAGLWEMDIISGLLWRSSRILDPDLPALQRPTHEGRIIRRAPSWSWMALVGPICQGISTDRAGSRGFSRLGVPCCVPRSDNEWPGPMVEYSKSPDSFELGIYGYVRRLRISQYSTRDHAEYSAWGNIVPYPTESLNRHTFRLEAEEAKQLIRGIRDPSLDWPNIAATGIFDMECKATNRPSSITALRLTSEEGLLLDEVYDSRGDTVGFRRVGVFVIENPVAFYPAHSIAANAYGGYDIIEGRLPVESMTLL